MDLTREQADFRVGTGEPSSVGAAGAESAA